MLAWLDLETTGLDPRRENILEIALLLTDDEVTLPGILVYDEVIHPLNRTIGMWDEYVREMHTKNGLISEIKANKAKSFFGVKHELTLALQPFDLKSVPLCGFSVHFDRAFLKEHMPEVEQMFSYRNIDVSSLKELAQRWGYPLPPKGGAHRAMKDLIESVEALHYFRENMFWPFPELAKEWKEAYPDGS